MAKVAQRRTQITRHHPVIPSTQKEYNDLATTTFGPIDKYVAANDNFAGARRYGKEGALVPAPVDESGASAGFGFVQVAEQQETSTRGPLGSGKPYLYSAKELAALDRQREPLHSLEDIAKLPGFIYLGSPYAKYHAGMEEAARVVTECAGKLMERGMRIYCPIAHGHAVTRYQELPRSWDYWKDQDQPLIDAASALIVLEMRGWWDSVGLKYEFESFLAAGKPIVYVEPSDLGVVEPGMRRVA